eukprot:6177531-Pleurochrysis_carterae.AAC.1
MSSGAGGAQPRLRAAARARGRRRHGALQARRGRGLPNRTGGTKARGVQKRFARACPQCALSATPERLRRICYGSAGALCASTCASANLCSCACAIACSYSYASACASAGVSASVSTSARTGCRWLCSLAEPLVPSSLHESAKAHANSSEMCIQMAQAPSPLAIRFDERSACIPSNR